MRNFSTVLGLIRADAKSQRGPFPLGAGQLSIHPSSVEWAQEDGAPQCVRTLHATLPHLSVSPLRGGVVESTGAILRFLPRLPVLVTPYVGRPTKAKTTSFRFPRPPSQSRAVWPLPSHATPRAAGTTPSSSSSVSSSRCSPCRATLHHLHGRRHGDPRRPPAHPPFLSRRHTGKASSARASVRACACACACAWPPACPAAFHREKKEKKALQKVG